MENVSKLGLVDVMRIRDDGTFAGQEHRLKTIQALCNFVAHGASVFADDKTFQYAKQLTKGIPVNQ